MQLSTNKGTFEGTAAECAEWLEQMQPSRASVLCCEVCGSSGESIDDAVLTSYSADRLLVRVLVNAKKRAALDCAALSLDVVETWRDALAATLTELGVDVEHVASTRHGAGWSEWTDAAGVVHRLECEDGAPALVWTRQAAEDERRRVTVRTLAQLADVRAEVFA